MKLPSNIRAMILPELKEFNTFTTQGPNGVSELDINHRAAAIECYLDLSSKNPMVRWTNYKKSCGDYQGALDEKEYYTKEFLKQTADTLSNGSYNSQKINIVLDKIVSECRIIAIKDNAANV